MSEREVRERIARIDKLRKAAQQCLNLANDYLSNGDALTIDHTWKITRRWRSGRAERASLDITGPAKDALRDWLREKSREWEAEADELAATLSTAPEEGTNQ